MAATKISVDEPLEFAKSIINTVREPLIVLDHDLRVVTASRSYYDLFKANPKETVGQLFYDLDNKQWDIPKLRELLETILPQKTTFDDYEVEHDFANIGRRIMLLNARQIKRASGKERIILLAIEDITERRQLEILLAESEKRYRHLFETANDGILLLEKREGNIAQANPAITTMLGYSDKEFCGKDLRAVGFPDDIGTIQEILQTLERDGIIHYQDTPIQTKTGQVLYTDIYMVDKTNLVQCNIRDITERKQAEKQTEYALRESEKKYRLIAEHMVDVITIADMNLRFTYVSPSVIRIRGFTVEEAMAQTLEQAVTPESLQLLLRAFEEEMQLEASGTADPDRTRIMELEEYRKGGSTIWLENTFSFIRDKDRKPVGILTLSRDITERRKARAAIQESEARYRVITENMSDMIWLMDMSFEITYITPSVGRIMGYTLKELKALPLEKNFAPDSWRIFRHVVTEELTPERYGKKDFKSERTLEFELYRKDGSSFWSEITLTLIRDNDGTPKGFVGVGRDITERKRTEEALILSEEKFRKAVLTSPDSIVITRLVDGMFVLTNQGFLELSGYTEKEVIGKTSFDIHIWENPEDREKITEKLSVEGSVKNFESRFRKKNGDVFSGLMSASIIDLNGLPHVLTITRDLTDRKRAEEKKARLEAQLQQSQKMEAIGTLAGGIAHDFNNILTAILGYTELVISDLPQGSDTRGNLEEVFKASLRAIDLVKQILVFSRQSETQLFPIRIHLIIKEALKLLRSSLPSTIEINQNIRALGTVLADLTQIHQIMMNLCTNASHAMSENGGELSVSLIQVDVPNDKSGPMDLPPGPYLKLTVSDTGCGMTPDVQNRIFEPYYTTKGIDKGTGLGLAVVHGIVQNHGGRITVESKPGNGSSFHVYLPEIMDSGEDKVTIKAVAPDATGTERILFVDDESTIVEMGKKMLERLGYEVAGSTSGAEALKLFRAKPDQFDLVITDMTMPHMTGDQLSKQLIEIKQDIPIILCTGFSEKMTEETAKEIGIREFIMKPISRQTLSTIIRNVLDAPESGYSLLNT